MISDFVYDLCHERETVTSRLSTSSSDAPSDVAKQLFGKKNCLPNSDTEQKSSYNLERAAQCGDWGEKNTPSDLFLKVSYQPCYIKVYLKRPGL